MMDTSETTRLHRCAKCGDDRSAIKSCEGDCYPLCGPCHDELRHEDAVVWRTRMDAAERERDDLAATLETRVAVHALAMARVRELEAIIAGRATPPTDAEIYAHDARGGAWLVTLPPRAQVRMMPETRYTSDPAEVSRLWWSEGAWWVPVLHGRPCAWPTAPGGAT